MNRKAYGFTIVELLIVIVVIAILAAISIVAYNSIQGRANNSAVQSDVRNLANMIRVYEAEEGSMPGIGSGGGLTLPGITFSPTKNAYFQNMNNLYVCTSQDASSSEFGIAARSKSGQVIAWSSARGFHEFTATASLNSSTTCPALGFSSYFFSYGKQAGPWNAWANG